MRQSEGTSWVAGTVAHGQKAMAGLGSMIRNDLLKMLVCPESQSPLRIASNELVAKINRGIAKGSLQNRAGQTLVKPIDGGLVRGDGRLLYPVVDEIPMMLVDEAIPLN